MISVELDIVDWDTDPISLHGLGLFDYDPTRDDAEFISQIIDRIKTVDGEVRIKYSLRLLDKYLIRHLTKEFVSNAHDIVLQKEIKSHLEKCLAEYRKDLGKE